MINPDDKWFYRVGGICALALGLAYLIIFPLFARVGTPPTHGEDWLTYLPGKTEVWWSILSLSVLTDFLFIPVALSLYIAFRRINTNAMLVATAFVGLFVVLDLSVTWTNYAALLTLSELYAKATTDLQRAGLVAAANYASVVLSSPTEVYLAVVDLSIGILITSCVMLRGREPFGRTTAWLGLATGISGLLSATGFFPVILLNALFATIWILFVSHRLLRLGQVS